LAAAAAARDEQRSDERERGNKEREASHHEKAPALGGLTRLQDSIDQLDRTLERVTSERDLPVGARVDSGVELAAHLAELVRAQQERTDGRAAAPEDEVVGSETRQFQLRLL